MEKTQINRDAAPVQIIKQSERLIVKIQGNVIHYNSEEPLAALSVYLKQKPRSVYFQCSQLGEWDSSLLVIIYEAIRLADGSGAEYDVKGLPQNLQDLVALAFSVDRKPQKRKIVEKSFVERVGEYTVDGWRKTDRVTDFCADILRGLGRLFSGSSVMRRIDFLSALDECGPKALLIVSLISFLVGLILAFVGAVQLKEFGAQIYVASLVTIGMCRIMGAIMVGVIMAGRTGSAYAATIGTMQVNEELDALETMGLSRIDFLVIPRLLSMMIAMPILTLTADFLGMLGGAFVGVVLMGLPWLEYWKYAFDAFNLSNFLVGIFHSFCFGIIIAVSGCYQGLNCGRNADSVGIATTASVVNAIVWMIVATGIITVIFMELGI